MGNLLFLSRNLSRRRYRDHDLGVSSRGRCFLFLFGVQIAQIQHEDRDEDGDGEECRDKLRIPLLIRQAPVPFLDPLSQLFRVHIKKVLRMKCSDVQHYYTIILYTESCSLLMFDMKNVHKLWLIVLSGVSVALFAVFTLLVKLDKFVQADFDLTVKIQNKVPAGLNDIFHLFSTAGHVGTMSVILIIILAIFLRKKLNGVVIMFLFYAGQGAEFFLKEALHQPGPPFQFHRVGSGVFFDKDYVVPGSSYPSGHSFRAVFIATTALYVVHRKYGKSAATLIAGTAACGLAVCIMAAKVVLGEHWVTDIVGGALLGAATAFFALLFAR